MTEVRELDEKRCEHGITERAAWRRAKGSFSMRLGRVGSRRRTVSMRGSEACRTDRTLEGRRAAVVA